MFERPLAFSATFVGLFALTFLFLAAVDALPEAKTPLTQQQIVQQTSTASPVAPENPVRVTASSIGLDEKIESPNSTDIEVLDDALLRGAVHYPGSALLNADGTVLLFGHSSYLPIIRNQAYKAFNGIQKLKTGETISVYSLGAEYRYSVVGVRLADASEDNIELPSDGRHLTLVTCDSFGKKTDRFVVTANLVGVYAL